MYIINNIIDGNVYRLHDQRDQQLRVINPYLILTLNKTGDLEFRSRRPICITIPLKS